MVYSVRKPGNPLGTNRRSSITQRRCLHIRKRRAFNICLFQQDRSISMPFEKSKRQTASNRSTRTVSSNASTRLDRSRRVFTADRTAPFLAVGSDHKGDDSSHDDESTSSDGHTSTLTRCSHATIQRDSDSSATQSSTSSDQYHRATPTRHVSAGKLSRYRRRAYNLALPPVVEQVNDEDAGDESH